VQGEAPESLAYTLGLVMGRGLCCLIVVGVLVWSAIGLIRRLSRKQQPPQPPYPSYPPQPATGVGDGQPSAHQRKIAFWARNKSFVDVELRPDGTLVFLGQDLNPDNPWGAEYEYALTVQPADVPRVVAALGGTGGDDILALLRANAEQIIGRGEQTWLRSLGIEPGFWSRVGDRL
jgi:hypothetical protein